MTNFPFKQNRALALTKFFDYYRGKPYTFGILAIEKNKYVSVIPTSNSRFKVDFFGIYVQ